MLVPVILAGGSGSRLWPLSREAYPKQFIPLFGGQSLFQKTLTRLSALDECSKPIVIGNEQHRFLMAEQLRAMNCPADLILEPAFKGTAPAVALAAVHALAQTDEDVYLLVLPADHVIQDSDAFASTIMQGVDVATHSHMVTFGVIPTHPETGYGYIQKGEAIPSSAGFRISQFVEKPNAKTAERYVQSQVYWWNSGMYLFSAAAFLQELLLHAPQIYHAAKTAMARSTKDNDFIRPNAADFSECDTDSIDYAVMEKTHNGAVVALSSDWNDVGAWDALAQLYEGDANANQIQGKVLAKDTRNCFINANQRLVVTLGVENLVVVETADAVLVMAKDKAQSIKDVVTTLKQSNHKEATFHQRVSRPWGAFESIDEGERFQVKRITVQVGQKLSLQRHHHRSEHWVVVKGTARVTRAEEVFLLAENQSTYIPIGVTHRLENVGKMPLEIIEVQSGSYLGEDDIERLDDHYGRLKETTLA